MKIGDEVLYLTAGCFHMAFITDIIHNVDVLYNIRYVDFMGDWHEDVVSKRDISLWH